MPELCPNPKDLSIGMMFQDQLESWSRNTLYLANSKPMFSDSRPGLDCESHWLNKACLMPYF